MKLAVLGFGREGESTLKFLKKSPAHQNADVWILDADLRGKTPRGVRKRIGRHYLKDLARFEIVFRSPGIPYNLPELVRARRRGVQFSSATKLFFERFRGNIIGITGSKGKSTAATLLYRMMKAAGLPVFLAGNIGAPALDILPKLKKTSWVVLELSSFQLQDMEASPRVAVVLDVFPEHQDSHGSLREYYRAKANIVRRQRRGDSAFYFKSNAMSRRVAAAGRGEKISVTEKGFSMFGPEDLKIRGMHMFRNAVMAAIVARRLGVSPKTIRRVLKNFRGLEHRLEFVRRMRIRDPKLQIHPNTPNRLAKIRGIRIRSNFPDRFIDFHNDSAATNPHAAAAAVRAFSSNSYRLPATSGSPVLNSSPPKGCQLILIAGGSDKGLNYKPLAQALRSSNAKLIVLYGENRRKIAQAIRGIKNYKLKIMLVKNLPAAIKAAYRFAVKSIIHNPPFIILFSPGAASFDQFPNYADRGRQFKKIVHQLQ